MKTVDRPQADAARALKPPANNPPRGDQPAGHDQNDEMEELAAAPSDEPASSSSTANETNSAEGTTASPSDEANAEAGDQPDNGRKKKIALIIFIIAAIVGLPLGIYYYMQSTHYESTDDAFIEGHVVQVSPRIDGHVQRVYIGDNQFVKAGELLFALDPSVYQAKVDAAEAQLKVAKANQQQAAIAVNVTSVTAASEERQGESVYESALAQVSNNQAMLETAGKRVIEAQAMVDTANAKAKQDDSAALAAKADTEKAEGDARRTKTLYDSHTVAREEYEHAMETAKSAEASLQAALDSAAATRAGIAQSIASLHATSDTVAQFQAQLRASQADAAVAKAKMEAANVAAEKIATAQAELETANANVGVAQANLDSAKLDLSYTNVRATSDGKVTRKNLEAGDYLTAGQNVFALVQPELWVIANFKENQLRYMNPGDKAEVQVDMYGNRKFQAHVESLQAGTGSRFSLLPPENATGNYVKVVQRIPVKLVFDETSSETANLAPGLSVTPKVRVK